MKTKILFISHEASLTGAPLVLLYFMEWLNDHHKDEYEIGILSLKGGELNERFNAVATQVYTIKHVKNRNFAFKVANKFSNGRISAKQLTSAEKCIQEIIKIDYDIIYANTVVTLPFAVQIKQALNDKPKLIAHVHELEVILKQQNISTSIINSVNHYIAVSNLVKLNLQNTWGIGASKIDVVYEFSKIESNKETIKKRKSKFTVGASGFVHWRKGHDIFIQVARYIHANHKDVDIEFCWVGSITEKEKLIVDADLKKMNLLDKVKFVGQQKNPVQFFSEFDVFLMTSREDPFPLVCIEVGMLGKPIICFDQATGTQEVLEKGGGKIVPYLNIEQMAEAVISYYNDEDLLYRDAQMAKNAFKGFTPEQKCPEIYKILNQIDV